MKISLLKHRGGAAVAALVATTSLASVPLSYAVSSASGSSPVTIGYEYGGDSALAVALHNKYFQQELGSQVSLKVYESGPAALSSIASGALNFICAIGFPPVISALAQGVPLEIIDAEDQYTTSAGLVATKSSGVTSIAQLKGKKIGLVIGSQSSFELAQFLKKGGLTPSQVTQVNLTPPELQAAFAKGDVDAGLTWSPVYNAIASSGTVLATDAILPPTADSYNVCVANKNWVNAHPGSVNKFLAALNKANVFANAHPLIAEQYNATLNGASLAIAKDITNGLISPTVPQQLTSAVLGSSAATVAQSGVATSILNNWKVLYADGTITTAPPANASQYIAWSAVAAAVKALK